MFKVLGALLLAYTVYAFVKGEVYARSFAWGKRVARSEDEKYFLTVIVIYAILSLALMTVF